MKHAARAAYLSGLIYESPSHIRDTVAVQFEFISKDDTQVGIFAYDEATYVVFRGTEASKWVWADIFSNMKVGPEPWWAGGRAHRGYAEAVLDVAAEVLRVLPNYPRPWIITGHSLGGCLATLFASYMAAPDETYTFGAPKCVDAEAAKTVPKPFYRIVYEDDIAPTYPADWTGYVHPTGRWHLKKDRSLTFQRHQWWHTLRPWFNGVSWGRAKKDHRVEKYVAGLR